MINIQAPTRRALGSPVKLVDQGAHFIYIARGMGNHQNGIEPFNRCQAYNACQWRFTFFTDQGLQFFYQRGGFSILQSEQAKRHSFEPVYVEDFYCP